MLVFHHNSRQNDHALSAAFVCLMDEVCSNRHASKFKDESDCAAAKEGQHLKKFQILHNHNAHFHMEHLKTVKTSQTISEPKTIAFKILHLEYKI